LFLSLIQPAYATTPAATELIGVPDGAAMSIPLCIFPTCPVIGWTRGPNPDESLPDAGHINPLPLSFCELTAGELGVPPELELDDDDDDAEFCLFASACFLASSWRFLSASSNLAFSDSANFFASSTTAASLAINCCSSSKLKLYSSNSSYSSSSFACNFFFSAFCSSSCFFNFSKLSLCSSCSFFFAFTSSFFSSSSSCFCSSASWSSASSSMIVLS